MFKTLPRKPVLGVCRVAFKSHRAVRNPDLGFMLLVTTPNEDALPLCPIPGCGRPPQARAGMGLSLTHCRYHIQKRNRHGSFWKGTYSAGQLRDYRRAATSYLKTHVEDFWIAAALTAVRSILDGAGPAERVVDVLTMRPPQKARAAFARMREAGVPPLRLLTIHLAVSGALKQDPIRPGDEGNDYFLTQVGKAALRTASGYHAVYGPGNRYDRYPRSSGLALRHIGRSLDEACEHVVAEHLAAILALKEARYGGRYAAAMAGEPLRCE